MIKLITDLKESLSIRMFHNTNVFDSLKGTENLTGVKTIWATEIRPVHRAEDTLQERDLGVLQHRSHHNTGHGGLHWIRH